MPMEEGKKEQPISNNSDSESSPHEVRLEVVKILLIRHAETVDNVSCKYAGTTNSPLTNYGVLQAHALATSLVKNQAHYITHIAASTLDRAYQTATAIHKAARDAFDYPEERDFTVTRCAELIERDFGSMEGKSYLETSPQPKRAKVDRKLLFERRTATSISKVPASSSTSGPSEDRYEPSGSETHDSLSTRANAFIDSYLLPLIHHPHVPLTTSPLHTPTIAIVSHGILLATLFRELVSRFRTVTVSPEAFEAGLIVDKAPRWDNTGYTLLRLHSPIGVRTQTPTHIPQGKLPLELVVQEINVTHHLKGLKRTGGGIGSARADPRQRSMKDFFRIKTAEDEARKPAAVVGAKHGRDEDSPLPPSQSQSQ